ncbi:MAG: ATP-binding protein [Chitinophagaceae bacterium]|nr:MAG: ATP-binding protein [Chitinophagaceae bacterium]
MIYKKIGFIIILRVVFLFIALLVTAFFAVKKDWLFLLYATPFVILALWYFFRYHKKIRTEMEQYVEAVHYRDFTRNFALNNSPLEILPLRKGFNEINDAFRNITREKEAQYQYLQKILELVDTAILSFETSSGDILWMNEALKHLLDLPYLKNIHLLKTRNESLYGQVMELKMGDNKIITLNKGARHIKVIVNVSAFQTDTNKYELIGFQNVNDALDETESQAWQRLLGVMTHEIMNSVAPIASLADTLKKRLQQSAENIPGEYKHEVLDDLELGIETIQRRSEGLTKFAETYRNLSKINNLELTKVLVRDLFENIYQLMQPTLQQRDIEMEIVLHDTSMIIESDRNLIEQVLINLVLNATEALKERNNPCITLSAGYDNRKPVLSVTDNGKGIPDELMDKIFIPFFSTRKNGNGIGLSLCKQIMMLHHGNIQVITQPGEGTAFRLVFAK